MIEDYFEEDSLEERTDEHSGDPESASVNVLSLHAQVEPTIYSRFMQVRVIGQNTRGILLVVVEQHFHHLPSTITSCC